MKKNQHNVPIRLSLQDAQLVRKGLAQLGDDGQKALKRIEVASKPASKGLVAINNVSREAKSSLESYAQGAGFLTGGLSKMGGAGLVAAAALAAVILAARRLYQATSQALDFVAALKDQADQAGINVTAYQELGHAASKLSITQDALTDGLKELTLRADEFAVTGKGPGAEAFTRLGYTQEQLQEGLKDTDALFLDVIERMEGLDKAAQIRIADEIFGGTGGEQFVRFMNAGVAGIERLRQEARDLGLVMDASLIARADESRDKLQTMQKVIDIQLNSALVDLGPILVSVASAFAEVARWVGETVDGFREVENMSSRGIEQQLAQLDKSLNQAIKNREKLRELFKDDPEAQQRNVGAAQAEIDRLRADIEGLNGILDERKFRAEENAIIGGAGSTVGGRGDVSGERYQETIRNLEFQLAQQGRTDLGRSVFTAINQAGIKETDERAQKIRELVTEIERLKAAEDAAEQEQKERDATVKKGQQITDRMRTAEEKRNDTLKELDALLKAGAINEETHARAVEDAERRKREASREAGDGITRAIDKYVDAATDGAAIAEQATTKFLTTTEDMFVKMATGAKVSFRDMADSIIADLVRIAVRQQIVAPLAQGIFGGPGGAGGGGGGFGGLFGGGDFGGLGGNSGGGIGGGLFNIFGAGSGFDGGGLFDFFSFHTGGIAGDPAAGRVKASPAAFAGAPRYHGGGIAGLAPDEIPAILKRGEPVFTPKQMENADGLLKAALMRPAGQNVNVVVHNNASNSQARVQQSSSGDGGLQIEVMIEEVEGVISGNVARGEGPLAETLESKYGLRRSTSSRR